MKLIAGVLGGVVVLSALGCGGSGSSSSAQSPFEGEFRGAWTTPAGGDNGTADITFQPSGAFTGTVHDSTTSTDGSVSGQITDQGTITGMGNQGGITFSATGTFTINALRSQVSGTITDTVSGNTRTQSYVLNRV